MKSATMPGIKLMVINLARAAERLKSVQALFAGAGLGFIRVDAVDASRLSNSFSRGSSRPKNRTQVSHIAGRHFTV